MQVTNCVEWLLARSKSKIVSISNEAASQIHKWGTPSSLVYDGKSIYKWMITRATSIFRKPPISLHAWCIDSCTAWVVYWTIAWVDLGKVCQEFSLWMLEVQAFSRKSLAMFGKQVGFQFLMMVIVFTYYCLYILPFLYLSLWSSMGWSVNLI